MSGIDRVGVVASSACAAHCALSALLPSVLSGLGLGMLLGHGAEWGFTLAAVAFAGAALVHGWRRHRSTPILAAFAIGIIGLLVARFAEEAGAGHEVGMILALVGGAVLVGGHLANIRATRRVAA